jgi:hypothetical protein
MSNLQERGGHEEMGETGIGTHSAEKWHTTLVS